MSNISKFENTLSGFTTTTINNDELIKSGIIFYESDKGQSHKDSKGKTHYITKQVIEEIVANTNKLLDEVDIPIVKEHKKEIDEQVGLISDKLEARTVTFDDVANRPKLQKLIGKTAIFCNSAKILDKVLIDKAKSGIPLRVSIGLDVPNKVIRELSVVTIPALNMATLFSKHEEEHRSNFGALTLAEQIAQRHNAELDKEAAKELFCDLLEVIENIKNADEAMLQGNDPNEMIIGAMDEFEDELALLLGIGEPIDDPNMQQAQQYNRDVVLDAFSMSEMENLILDNYMYGSRKKNPLKKFNKQNNTAEFFGNINLNLGGRKKKEPGLLTKAARTVGTGVALAAGARYGGAALLKNSTMARGLASKGLKKVQTGATKLAASSNNNMIKNAATNVSNAAAGGRKSLTQYRTRGGVKQGSGAMQTIQNDIGRVGGAISAMRDRFRKKKTTV